MRLASPGRIFAGRPRAAARSEPIRLPLSRAKQSRRLLLWVFLAAFASLAFAFVLAALNAPQDPASPEIGSAGHPAPPPAWIEISAPDRLFHLEAPELVKAPTTYEARRHRTGGGRQDVLVVGGSDGAAPFLRLTMYRVGAEPAPEAAFFVDLASRAAEAGRAISRAAQPTALPTRLGVFEVADLNLTRGGAFDAACLGFRIADAARQLRIAGFACGGEAPFALFASKPALACVLDRIGLDSTVDDKILAAFFAARELNGDTACPDPKPPPAPVRTSRFDDAGDDAARQGRRKMH
jgi:hypothetical protein